MARCLVPKDRGKKGDKGRDDGTTDERRTQVGAKKKRKKREAAGSVSGSLLFFIVFARPIIRGRAPAMSRSRKRSRTVAAEFDPTDGVPRRNDAPAAQNVVEGDCRQRLADYADCSFDCCVTSPPYWGLRDYGVDGQIGAEDSLDAYVESLVVAFREVRRVLSDAGTLWLNLGDAFTSGGRATRAPDKKNPGREMAYRPPTPSGLKAKDLIGLPWRVAFALQADGWYLRSDIVWHKPNCQPESVRDRPTRAHEYVFLLSKSAAYHCDHEAVREPAATGGGAATRSRR